MDSKQINDLVKVDSNKYSNSDSKFEYGTFSNMNGKSGIYSIFNKITNKEYIGSTSNIGSRITKHFSELKLNTPFTFPRSSAAIGSPVTTRTW